MSVILDALKKLERDKAVSRKGPVDIVPQIMVPRKDGVRSPGWKIPVVIIGVVAATAAATTVIVITLSSREGRPVSVVTADSENAQPVFPPAVPREQIEPRPVPEPAAGRLAADPPKVPHAKLSRHPAVEDGQASVRPDEPKTAAENSDDSVRTSGVSVTDLNVSGIAWQDARADRRAVVNGALVGEGAVVSGARIVRIYQDKVRFSRSGETFEINVAGSPQPK